MNKRLRKAGLSVLAVFLIVSAPSLGPYSAQAVAPQTELYVSVSGMPAPFNIG